MGNHFHLLLEVFSQGWNRVRGRQGHVFQGRYKLVPVNGSDADRYYFRIVADYIHLNPARAGLAGGRSGTLADYRWSGLPCYAKGKAPPWLEMGRVLNSFELASFAGVVSRLGGSCRAVFETSMNWHLLHDIPSSIPGIEEVVMAHPFKARIICYAQLKNDKVDAMRLAQLLRLDMVACAHASSAESRNAKEIIRQRSCWVGMRTRIRNGHSFPRDKRRDCRRNLGPDHHGRAHVSNHCRRFIR